ncbi:MAG: hypothetical protein JW833_17730 [Prolixibacteraceae bacterium]|nr:hypothetical protein [Prolixibacteraceae bacterium]
MESQNQLFKNFPDKEEMLKMDRQQSGVEIPEINGHIHTPHSFSAFKNMEQPFVLAKKENIAVLGINDFYTTDGYEEFALLALKHKVFPLFNIEFMALQNDLQEAGIRVNDPNNPGRTYLSGKGLNFPVSMSEKSFSVIKTIQDESNRQTYKMVEKLNAFLEKGGIDLFFNAEKLHKSLAKNLFRERHIAQAVRIAVFAKEETLEGRKNLLEKIFLGKKVKSSLDDVASLENEIRGNLLKAGGPAFVEEDPRAFLSLEEVTDLIIDTGGIPCYPVLLDDSAGNFTDYEADREKLYKALTEKGIYFIELIPGRNDAKILKEFVSWFHQKGFVITFGTEHNTPKLDPMLISCRGGVPLDNELKIINFEGAAIIAAHQYLNAKGEEGFLKGILPKLEEKEKFTELGKAVIRNFINKK